MSQQRPWLQHYPPGCPVNIDENAYPTVLSYIEGICKKYAKKPAFALMGKDITYEELDKKSSLFGAYLIGRGLEAGDRIALMMPNILQYPIALFGAMKAGLVVVNTNPLYTPREMEHQFKDSEVKAIVILENFAYNLEKVIDKTPIKTVILTSVGGLLGGAKGAFVDFAIRRLKKAVPKYNLKNTVRLKDALKQGKQFEIPGFENGPDSVVVHQYTGGTTGVSKGAMLTNKNLICNMLQTKAFLEPHINSEGELNILCPLPLYHIFAFTINCLVSMDLGARAVLIVNPKDLKTVIKEFHRYEIHGLTGVNTLYNALLNNKDFRALDFGPVQFASAGGTALQKGVAQEWEKLTGKVISEGYGMTEASPVVTVNPLDRVCLGTTGIPVPSTDVRVVSEEGEVLAIGEPGEIQVKGPQVMKGYYKRPEETAKTIKDGWLCTGDIGTLNDEGYLSIVDRKKDMILVSGFNVYPNEIEDVVCLHPKVSECAAIGIKSDKSGEVVKVFVTKSDKSLSKDELLKHCKENMTGYKVPKEIEFRDELPKSTVGKILRKNLRE